MADEVDFLELLIANERVLSWLEILQSADNAFRKKQALYQLKAAVESKSSYVEEAYKAGAVGILTDLIAKSDDQDLFDVAASIIAICSGPMARGGQVSEFCYGSVVVRVKEGALGDGLGVRVWAVAHILCSELVSHPMLVSGKQVLELGSGCGPVGITAAALGAKHVTLTDYMAPVLHNLRSCVALNATAEAAVDRQERPVLQENGRAMPAGSGDVSMLSAEEMDEAMFEQAESVDDLNLEELMGPESESAKGDSWWDFGNMCVRFLDWQDCIKSSSVPPFSPVVLVPSGQTLTAVEVETYGPVVKKEESQLELPPKVDPAARFEVVLGSDVLYELQHARLLAAVIAHSLAAKGACILSCAVRNKRLFTTFALECRQRGLRCRCVPAYPSNEHDGIMGRRDEYEGGFILMALDRAAAPFEHWYRDDFDELQFD